MTHLEYRDSHCFSVAWPRMRHGTRSFARCMYIARTKLDADVKCVSMKVLFYYLDKNANFCDKAWSAAENIRSQISCNICRM